MEVYKGDERCQQTLTVMSSYEYLILNKGVSQRMSKISKEFKEFQNKKNKT